MFVLAITSTHLIYIRNTHEYSKRLHKVDYIQFSPTDHVLILPEMNSNKHNQLSMECWAMNDEAGRAAKRKGEKRRGCGEDDGDGLRRFLCVSGV